MIVLGPLPCISCARLVVLVREPLDLVYGTSLGRLQVRDETGQMPHACPVVMERELVVRPPSKDRRTWREACACGGSILVRDLPLTRAEWNELDWGRIAEAERWHHGQPAHVAWRMGYKARETVALTRDGLPILELI